MLALVTYACVFVCITRLAVDNPSLRQAATATATQAAATCFLYLTRASLLTFANGFAFAFAPIWPQGILSKREISKRSFCVCVCVGLFSHTYILMHTYIHISVCEKGVRYLNFCISGNARRSQLAKVGGKAEEEEAEEDEQAWEKGSEECVLKQRELCRGWGSLLD